MQGITSVSVQDLRNSANTIKNIANEVNNLIGRESGKINTDLASVESAWQGQAADAYREEVRLAQLSFDKFYTKILDFATAINSSADLVEITETKSTIS